MDRKECLRKAQEIVCNDREDAYGKPEDNYESIADLWRNLFAEMGESFLAGVMDGIKGVKRQTHEGFDKPKFRFEDYLGKYVMHCDTKEKAEKFCEILAKNGRICSCGTSHGLDKFWKNYEKNTCYNLNKAGYGYVNFYKNKNYTILEFDDFDWSE